MEHISLSDANYQEWQAISGYYVRYCFRFGIRAQYLSLERNFDVISSHVVFKFPYFVDLIKGYQPEKFQCKLSG